MKKRFSTLYAILGFMVLAGLFILYQYPQWYISSDQSELLKRARLELGDQVAGQTVTITYATLPFAGFVVVRNNMGDKPGDIIGVSNYLEAGRYKSVSVKLTTPTMTGQTLIAGIVTDDGNRRLDTRDTLLNDNRGNPVIQSLIVGTSSLPLK